MTATRALDATVVADPGVRADHPCLAGHFPGRPIVPAVLLLERVMAAAGAAVPEARVTGVGDAKCVRPLPPGRPFMIRLGPRRADRIAFEVLDGDDLVARGRLSVEARP